VIYLDFEGVGPVTWSKDFNQDPADYGGYTQEDSFAIFENSNGGLRMRTGNDGQSSFVWFHDCPLVTDFDLTFVAKVSSSVGSDYSGFVGWRDDDAGTGTETSLTFAMQWGVAFGGFMTPMYGGSPITGWSSTGYVNTPSITAGTAHTFRLLVQGTSFKAWLDGVQIFDATNTNLGVAGPIYFGNENLSFTTAGETTFVSAYMIVL
jgi:hypothetical protein